MTRSVTPSTQLDNQHSTADSPERALGYFRFDGYEYPIREDEHGAYILIRMVGDELMRIGVNECALCEGNVLAGDDVRHLDKSLCHRCADAVMNLKHHKHSGRYITWPNEEPERERKPSRQPISARRRREVYERDHYACRYCGARQKLVIDHIHPWSRGGTNAVENLATACEPCNVYKFDRTPEEAGMTLHDPEHFA